MSFPHNMTRVAIISYKNVDYDVKPAKMRFTSHENLLVHPLSLAVSSQREQTIVTISYHYNTPTFISLNKLTSSLQSISAPCVRKSLTSST